MKRNSFFSFHYIPDNWRASQVRQMGAIDGNPPVSDNDWEKVKGGGEQAIKNWISGQMTGKTCIVVLAGKEAANRKWINHEISEGWRLGKGVLAVAIHNLKDSSGSQTSAGSNPLEYVTAGGKKLSTLAKFYSPPSTSTACYSHIKDNLAAWVEEAITIRAKQP